MTKELEELIAKAKEKWDSMTQGERDKMIAEQREGYVKAELSWPKSKFKYINGVKVYDSYEDYCND